MWTPWAIVGLTKRMYLDKTITEDAGDGYREFGLTFSDTEYGGLVGRGSPAPTDTSTLVPDDEFGRSVGVYCGAVADTLATQLGTVVDLIADPPGLNSNLTYRLFSTRRVDLTVIPSPVRGGDGALHVTVREAGTVTLVVYDLLGRRVRALPTLEAASPGEYTTTLGMDGVPDGSYVVVARYGGTTKVVRFDLIR